MVYYAFFAFFVFAYVGMLFLFRYLKNAFWANLMFCANVFLPYLALVIYIAVTAGVDDWNFINALPSANVSQFMFSTCWIALLLPKKVKKYHLLLIALLSVGMFLSPSIALIRNGAIGYRFLPHFLLDYLAHYVLSLWGVYIIYSKQVELKVKDSLIAGSIIVVVALIMMIMNVLFDTSFFGLSLNGKHNIYLVVLTDNSYLSALIYFTGLTTILFLGFFYQGFLPKALKAYLTKRGTIRYN